VEPFVILHKDRVLTIKLITSIYNYTCETCVMGDKSR